MRQLELGKRLGAEVKSGDAIVDALSDPDVTVRSRTKPSRAPAVRHNKLCDFSGWGDSRDYAAIAVEVAVPDVAIRPIRHNQHLAGGMQREGAKLPTRDIEAGDLMAVDNREPEVAVHSLQEKCRP